MGTRRPGPREADLDFCPMPDIRSQAAGARPGATHIDAAPPTDRSQTPGARARARGRSLWASALAARGAPPRTQASARGARCVTYRASHAAWTTHAGLVSRAFTVRFLRAAAEPRARGRQLRTGRAPPRPPHAWGRQPRAAA